MKLLTGWVLSAGLVLAATSANAQAQAPDEIGHSRASAGADGPYAAMPPEGRGAGSGPTLLPAREVYTVLRDNGFSALGSPHQHGDFYTVSVTDRRGGEGRLVIDARDGQIVRFMRGDRMDASLHDDVTAAAAYGPGGTPLSVSVRGVPRPPASVPHVASRTVPLPKAPPPRPGRDPGEPKPLAATPAAEPAQQAAAVEAKPAGPSTTAQNPAPAVVQAKPAEPQILPTQQMPKVQDLE
jgi:hypothetical protein